MIRWLGTSLVCALVALAPLSAPGADDFRLLRLGGQVVKWGQPKLGLPSTVTYALVDEPMHFPDARNCRGMVSIDRLVSRSKITRQRFVEELEAALAAWEAVAGVAFERAADPRMADIKIGAQAAPKRWAFADVRHRRSTAGKSDGAGVHAIDRALICLNPTRRWALDFSDRTGAYNLRYVLMHEVGHALGLNHTRNEDQVMSFKYPDIRRGLQHGDIKGVVILYGEPSRGTRVTVGYGSGPDRRPTMLESPMPY